MGISLLDKQFNDYIKRLEILKLNTLKCIELNNVCLKKLQLIEIVPIPEEEYTLRDIYNNALSYTLRSLQLSKMQIEITKKMDKYSLIAHEDEFINDYNYVLEHTKRFYKIANDIINDGLLVDLQLEDIEQHHYLINQIATTHAMELTVAINKIQKSLENSNGDKNGGYYERNGKS